MPVHEHYGTGIASGLVDRPGYAVGGRVNLQEGTSPSLIDQAKQAASITEAQSMKEDMLEGRTVLGGPPPGGTSPNYSKISPIAKAYNIQLYQLLNVQGITKDSFDALNFDEKTELVQRINQQILNNLADEYGFELEQLVEHFGGDDVVDNSFRTIKAQLKTKPEKMSEAITEMQEQFNSVTTSMKEIAPDIFKSPKITVSGLDDEDAQTEARGAGEAGDALQGGLMGLDPTGDEFREKYVDYLTSLQDETGIAEKRKREAIEAGFFNLGAADPVQPGESLVQAGIRAFKDPMAALRAQEAVQAEDIYKRGAETLDRALRPSESREVLLLEQLVQAGIPRAQAIDIVTGRELQRSRELEALIGSLPELIEEKVAGDPEQGIAGMTAIEAAEELLGEGLTKPTIIKKDGGRVNLQQGGTTEALATAATPQAPEPASMDVGSPEISPMSFEELREKLPSYIDDEVVKLLSENPMALMELAQAQTEGDLREFEEKYNVDVTMPLAESEEETDVGDV